MIPFHHPAKSPYFIRRGEISRLKFYVVEFVDMSGRSENEIVASISEQVFDLNPNAQWFVYLPEGKNKPHLLSLSTGSYYLDCRPVLQQHDFYKIWVQGSDHIQIDISGPVGEFDQLVFQGAYLRKARLELIRRCGYVSVPEGEELTFLEYLLTKGRMEWVDKGFGF